MNQTIVLSTNVKILVPVIQILPQLDHNVIVNIMALKDNTVMKKLVSIFLLYFLTNTLYFSFFCFVFKLLTYR